MAQGPDSKGAKDASGASDAGGASDAAAAGPAPHDPRATPPLQPQRPAEAIDASTRRLLPWLVAVAFFMQALDATIVNTALPAMAHSLGESPLQMQSVVVAYMLTVALLIPASAGVQGPGEIRNPCAPEDSACPADMASLRTTSTAAPSSIR